MKKRRNCFVAFVFILAVLLIAWLITSFICNGSDSWKITLKDWVLLVSTIVIGIFVTYILNERNTKKRLFINAYVDVINSTLKIIEQCRSSIQNDYLKTEFTPIVLSLNRMLNNSITLIGNYSKKMNCEDKAKFLEVKYAEFKTLTTECIDSLKNQEKRQKAFTMLDSMANRLDEIKLQLFDMF